MQSSSYEKKIIVDDILVNIKADGSFESDQALSNRPYGWGQTVGKFYTDSIYFKWTDSFGEDSKTFNGKKVYP